MQNIRSCRVLKWLPSSQTIRQLIIFASTSLLMKSTPKLGFSILIHPPMKKNPLTVRLSREVGERKITPTTHYHMSGATLKTPRRSLSMATPSKPRQIWSCFQAIPRAVSRQPRSSCLAAMGGSHLYQSIRHQGTDPRPEPHPSRIYKLVGHFKRSLEKELQYFHILPRIFVAAIYKMLKFPNIYAIYTSDSLYLYLDCCGMRTHDP